MHHIKKISQITKYTGDALRSLATLKTIAVKKSKVGVSFELLQFSKSVNNYFLICFLDLSCQDILVQQSIHFVKVEHNVKLQVWKRWDVNAQ